MRALLISSSVCHPTGYLDHAEEEIRDLLGAVRRVLFLPYALFDRDAYAAKAAESFGRMGYEVVSAHRATNPARAALDAEAVFVGGGNTFRLLKSLYDLELLRPLRDRALEGMPYVGASAGTNVAGVTIGTTNDMPIVEPPSFEALGLVDFNLNPHYLDPDPASTHKGETRDERIAQFLEESATPVVALREGAMLRVDGDAVTVCGTGGGRIFRRGREAVEIATGEDLRPFLAENIRRN
ncbi:MAG TPA: dipeptidase PepE [Thermoanaerobaculia bacterium]|jgi:dipeptidase E|nr:dipeptidase PepE [Thermoanaerobaculia bacterium]